MVGIVTAESWNGEDLETRRPHSNSRYGAQSV